jgi:hypothetical protein
LTTIEHQEHAEAEPALARAAEDVAGAKIDIRWLLGQEPDRSWTVREIQDAIPGWSGTIVSLALMDMERSGEVATGVDLRVRVVALASS